MHAYRLTGGPCHWDLQLCFYVFLGPRYARAAGANPNTAEGRRRLSAVSQRQLGRLQTLFDDFFNPDKSEGVWTSHLFGRCCSFHVDVEFKLPPSSWSEMDLPQIENAVPDGCGLLIVERLNLTEHPHASLGGRRMLVRDGEEDGGEAYSLAHEMGHILGLPDHYTTPDVPSLGVKGNGMTPDEENRHVGHLMGKRDAQGKRALDPHEIQEIAQATGMTCDRRTCCPDGNRVRTGMGTEDTAVPRLVLPRVEARQKHRTLPESGSHGHQSSSGPHRGVVTAFDLARDWLSPEEFAKLDPLTPWETHEHDRTEAGLAKRIAPRLDEFLAKNVAGVPGCAPAEHRTHVYARLLVQDCEEVTDAEKREMSDQLIQKGMESASVLCSLNKLCPRAVLVSYRFDRTVCENRLWEVDLTWTFKCVD